LDLQLQCTYAICAYHYWCCELESRSVRGVQHYVIKFVSDLRQVDGLISPGPPVSSTNKTDRHDITEIVLKVALNTIKQTNKQKTSKRIRDLVCCDHVLFRSTSVDIIARCLTQSYRVLALPHIPIIKARFFTKKTNGGHK